MDGPVHQCSETGQISTNLNDHNVFRSEADLLQRNLGRVIRRRAEAADRNAFSLQILGSLDFGPNQTFIGNEVDTARDDRRVCALKIRRNRQRPGGENNLQLIRQHGLHRWRTAFQRQILAIEPVFLKNSLLVRRPSDGMNRR